MTFIFFLLNFIQATAEFLPISSSGHLIVTETLYNISEHGLEAFLHLPTALAIFIAFWSVFWGILKERKTWPILIAAIIPAGLIGFFLGDAIDAVFYSPFVVGLNQLFWGTFMWYTAYNHPKHSEDELADWKELSVSQALKIGFTQVLALIPGTSRSGITTLGGMWQGLPPQQSATFSFISGFPLIAAASGIGLLKLVEHSELLTIISPFTLVAGMLMSLGLGLLFIKLFTSRHTLTVMKYSGIYRIILGFLILVWLT